LALAGAFGSVHASPDPRPSRILDRAEWQPLTRSLLERARMTGRCCTPPDRATVERIMGQFADSSGYAGRPVIKWMGTPSDAFEYLSRFGLDALLDMGEAKFWRRFRPSVSPDARALDRAFEVRMLANELLGVDERDRLLMAPKLHAKSDAMSSNASEGEIFRVRAVSSQIGWLETSMADAAAEAVSNVELLLGAGASEGSVAIDNQLRIFETHECGLIVTWETPDALVCV
jgi:hypothetical protein